MDLRKIARHFVFFLALAPLVGGVGLAKTKQPDLTQSCAKECPNAANNDDAFKCVEDLEHKQGEDTFKKQHHACYKAHEKYEKISGKEEAETG